MFIVIASHPIQYQTPVWKILGGNLGNNFLVIYLCRQGIANGVDSEFGREVFWDFDLLEGYNSEFIPGCPERVLGFYKNRLTDRHYLVSRLRELKPKVVLINGWNLAGYIEAALITKFFVKSVLWLRCEANNLKRIRFFRSTARSCFLFFFLKLFSHFFYIGSANRDLYLSLGIPSERLTFAGYGVDNEKFTSQPEKLPSKKNLRAKFGLNFKSKVVLFCGKLVKKKRPLDVVKAAKEMNFQVGDSALQLLFVGSGELEAELRKEAGEIATNGNSIIILGFLNQSEIADVYHASDLLILPSDANETWGLVVNEALASGTPAAASDSCGCARDLIERYYPELVFPEGDIGKIQKAIERGVDVSEDEILNSGVLDYYSSQVTAQSLLNAYA